MYYKVKKNESLLGIADLFKSRVIDIRNWNNIPYTQSVSVGQRLQIFVPTDKKDFYASLDNQTSLEKSSAKSSVSKNSNKWIYHRIRRGENLNFIASRYGVDVNTLKDWNNLSSNRIYAGQKIKIYTNRTSYVASSDNTAVHSQTSVFRYRVRRGDTISELSIKFGVPSVAIRRWNNLISNRLVAGKTLKIYNNDNAASSMGDNAPKTSANINYYKVKRGDAIGLIAEKYKVRVSSIRRWNNLRSNRINSGQTLKIYSDADVNDITSDNDASEGKAVPAEDNGNYLTYTVKSGDALVLIADKFNVPVESIRKTNGLSGTKIKIGQELKINKNDILPPKKKEKQEVVKGKFHTVTRGESLYTIARKFGKSVKDLKGLNNLHGNVIKIGDKLRIE